MTTEPEPQPLVDEQLSAWLDDELPGTEVELLASRLAQAPALRARVARYAQIGNHLRGGTAVGGLATLRLIERVGAAIDGPAEPAGEPASGRAAPRLPYAIAASIVLLVVALVPLVRMAGVTAPDTTALIGQPDLVPVAVTPARLQRAAAGLVGAAGQASLSSNRLTSYLVYHGEYSGMLSAKVADSHIVNHRPYAVAVTSPRPEGAPGQ